MSKVIAFPETKDFGNGWFGKLVDTVEVKQVVILGQGFVPPVGIEAAYDNWTQQAQYNDEFFAMFPELKVDHKRIINDRMEGYALD